MDNVLTETCTHKYNPSGASLVEISGVFADSLSSVIGGIDAGTLANTQAADQTYLRLSEVNEKPAFDHRFTFIPGIVVTSLIMVGRYEGNVAHEVLVQAWNGSGWDTLGTLVEADDDATFTYTLTSAHTIAGVVIARWYHTSSGNPNHYVDFDQLCVCGTITCSPIDPMSDIVRQAYPIEKQFMMRQSFTKYTAFVAGDYLVADSVTYAVKIVNPWPAQGSMDKYYHLILEQQSGS